jgi:RimJ/RimL family protein N-acetyltransferase
VAPVAAPIGETTELRDGRTVLVRPIAPGDKRLLAEAFERLSAESRRRRFLTPATDLSSEDLAYLTEVDHTRHEALVAIDPADGSIVGSARYVQVPREREAAEVAVAVVDDWQRRGVATALLSALSKRAHENDIERFRAYVSSENAVVVDALTPPSSSSTSRFRRRTWASACGPHSARPRQASSTWSSGSRGASGSGRARRARAPAPPPASGGRRAGRRA